MRFFRNRETKLLEQHLKRKGIERDWWPTAKLAIAHCENGEWLEPMITAAGPASARQIVLSFGLEPFVSGGLHSDAVANPFLNPPNPARRSAFDERLGRAISRRNALYEAGEHTTLSNRGSERAPGGGIPDKTVARLLDQTILTAAEEWASEIHFAPEADCLVVGYMIEGVLGEVQRFPRNMISRVIARLKEGADLDIDERHEPQVGRFTPDEEVAAGREIEIEVEARPTAKGEYVILRLIDR